MVQYSASQFRSLEGQRVGIALTDGSRIDDCELISLARTGLQTLWLLVDGLDVFIPVAAIETIWATAAAVPAA